jgi:hypothetical protein
MSWIGWTAFIGLAWLVASFWFSMWLGRRFRAMEITDNRREN